MNPYYKQPIIAFGLAAPLVLLLVLFGLGFHYKGKLEQTYETRRNDYKNYQNNQKVREGLEQVVKRQQPVMNKWMALFDADTATTINGILGEVEKRFPGEEFQQTSYKRTNARSGIGGASSQASAQFEFKFRGTYRGLQNAFLEMETQMPQLQLDTLKIKQDSSRNVLTADLLYTAWKKE